MPFVFCNLIFQYIVYYNSAGQNMQEIGLFTHYKWAFLDFPVFWKGKPIHGNCTFIFLKCFWTKMKRRGEINTAFICTVCSSVTRWHNITLPLSLFKLISSDTVIYALGISGRCSGVNDAIKNPKFPLLPDAYFLNIQSVEIYLLSTLWCLAVSTPSGFHFTKFPQLIWHMPMHFRWMLSISNRCVFLLFFFSTGSKFT